MRVDLLDKNFETIYSFIKKQSMQIHYNWLQPQGPACCNTFNTNTIY